MKVLCVGVDPQLLESRRLVLQSAGFEASCYFPSEAAELLPSSTYELMIISVGVSEADRATLVAAAPGHMRLIQIQGFVLPEELLKLVKQ